MMDNMSLEKGVMLCALETPHVVIPDQYQSIYEVREAIGMRGCL